MMKKPPGGVALAIIKGMKPKPKRDDDEAPEDSDPEDVESEQVAYDEFADAMDSGDRDAARAALKAFIQTCKY